jgi:hypothetical protein
MKPENDLAAGLEVDRAWRRWLWTLMALATAFCVSSYAAIVLIDPFSTGRFALTQRIDRAPDDTWHWFAKAGIIRDPQFDGVIIGSSVAGTLDPVTIGTTTGHTIAQLALYGGTPQNNLLALRSFRRHHRDRPLLYILTLDALWCTDKMAPTVRPLSDWLPEFPAWVYESSDFEYLARIFSPFAIRTAFQRLGIWLGVQQQVIRADGFAPIFNEKADPRLVLEKLLATQPPTDATPPAAPFPSLDQLAEHLASLDQRSPVLLTFVPVFVNALARPGTNAAARDAACKARVADIAARRPNTGVLDLQGDNPLARSEADYIDALHFRGNVAKVVDVEVAKAVIALQSQADAPRPAGSAGAQLGPGPNATE